MGIIVSVYPAQRGVRSAECGLVQSVRLASDARAGKTCHINRLVCGSCDSDHVGIRQCSGGANAGGLRGSLRGGQHPGLGGEGGASSPRARSSKGRRAESHRPRPTVSDPSAPSSTVPRCSEGTTG